MNVTLVSLLPDLLLNDSLLDANRTGEDDELVLGHQYPLWKIILISVVAACLSVVTVIGNIMVMVSFKMDKQLQNISNYFLFSLAVADFAIGLISMPLFTLYTVLGYWPLGSHICDTWLALDYLASNASVLNLLIISFDRYFSVMRPLTYRAKRTTAKAGVMIACAWGISLLLWPPWIYAWPYIEGERTVPAYACYIQFIETNHYITFGTAIAAFYVPVSVMIFIYWRIWQETEKRQKDLPNLMAASKQDASKRSNSSDEALDLEECRRPRSESSTGVGDEVNSTHIAVSLGHYPEPRVKHRPLSWTWLKSWCVAWWHSGRDDEDDDDDDDDGPGGAESSRTGAAYDETLTPVSLETPVPSMTSRCDSIDVIQSSVDGDFVPRHRPGAIRSTSAATIASKNAANDGQVYTILIRLPGPPSTTGPRGSKEAQMLSRFGAVEVPSIKMYPYQEEAIIVASTTTSDVLSETTPSTTTTTDRSLTRRPSQMQPADVRIPLNAKNVRGIAGRAGGDGGGASSSSGGAGAKVPAKKKKKSQEKKAEKKAAKTLSAILAAFIITWTPYNILVLLKPLTACTGCIPQELWDFFYYLCYINSTVNPVLYALCNTTFRKTYVRILKCKWHNRKRTGVNWGY